ncbi:hypothetical protein Cfor_09839, partial [Coptotermes formosanus]
MLFHYRNCEQATTGVAPAEAMLGRRLRSRLDALRPDIEGRVQNKQYKQIERAGGTERLVNVGDRVYVRDYTKSKDKWIEGQVSSQEGPSSYSVKLQNNTVKRHIDQILEPKQANKNRFSLTRTSIQDNLTEDNANDIAERNDIDDSIADQSPKAADSHKHSP